MYNSDLSFMGIAIQEAEIGFSNSNFPVGAVLTINDQLIDSTHNKNREFASKCNHAENILLVKHSSLIKASEKRNEIITLYVTLEPCLYCFGGILQHRFNRLVFSAYDPMAGSSYIYSKLNNWYREKEIEIVQGVLCDEYMRILHKYNQQNNKLDWESFIAANNRFGNIY